MSDPGIQGSDSTVPAGIPGGPTPVQQCVNELDRFAGRHDGVISRAQALALGLSSTALERRVSAGRWTRMASGIYMPAGQPVTQQAMVRIAVLRCGRGALASGPTAAWWLGLLERPPAHSWVTIPRARRYLDRSVTVRRRDVPAVDVAVARDLRVTGLALTVLETAVILEEARPGDGTQFLDRALQTRTSLDRLQSAHARNPGRVGSPRAAAMLVHAATGGESEAERIFLRLLRTFRITGWECAVRSCGYVIDVAFVDRRVAIEIDGWAYHRTAERMAHDAVRQNALVNDGWTILRFTYHRLIREPEAVIAEVRRALRR
ncbi:type IV toxin-antitoxin system AbiEi family antitoxin domain-containing protein [Rhodococcus sp. NBC_00297]|uniref:type IV toxin-antitoxin system AbiEi family antitoxin domain-containing protein n=1 Tax=Rhodococcus sp. NBC_00297 TaxID=2976005 RepID=UPI002E2A8383|nr:type IV toxin-antitoxin system AbiEi family antitoxin domain-containing protein [Rhodococcus sp. NBC_00297]